MLFQHGRVLGIGHSCKHGDMDCEGRKEREKMFHRRVQGVCFVSVATNVTAVGAPHNSRKCDFVRNVRFPLTVWVRSTYLGQTQQVAPWPEAYVVTTERKGL